MTSVKSAISILIITSFMIISCSNAKSAGVGDSTGMSDSASTVATATTPVQVSFQMLEGSWELYNAIKGNVWVQFTFDDKGKMHLTRYRYYPYIPGVEALDQVPMVTYDGSYEIRSDGKITYSLTDCDKDSDAEEGSISVCRSGDYYTFSFDQDLTDVALAGDTLVMFNTAEVYSVKLGAKPSVRDLFKASLSYLFNPTVKDAASLILDGKQPDPEFTATKVVDLPSGYLSFQNGGAPSSGMEACIWRCNDGSTLLAINVLGESPDVQPTTALYLFRYYADGWLRRLDGESEKIFHVNSRIPQAVSFPRKGKDIKVTQLNAAYEADTTETLKWTGNGF